MPSVTLPGVWARAKLGVFYGLAFASVYSVVATAIVLIGGAESAHGDDVSLPWVIVAYFFGGIIGGSLVAVLAPLGRRLLGAMFIGFLVAFQAVYFLGLVAVPVEPWSADLFWISLWTAVFLGPLCALGLRYVDRVVDPGGKW